MKKFLVMLALVSGVVQADYDSTEFTKEVEACAKIKAVEQFKGLTAKFKEGLYGINRAWAMEEKIINPPKVEDMRACSEILSKYIEVLKNINMSRYESLQRDSF